MSKLLLVEDDKTIVENLCVFLQQEGFFVESVFGQKQAIELLEEKYYDLVLLDISLADGNGFAICSYIKQNTDIPVIFLTRLPLASGLKLYMFRLRIPSGKVLSCPIQLST